MANGMSHGMKPTPAPPASFCSILLRSDVRISPSMKESPRKAILTGSPWKSLRPNRLNAVTDAVSKSSIWMNPGLPDLSSSTLSFRADMTAGEPAAQSWVTATLPAVLSGTAAFICSNFSSSLSRVLRSALKPAAGAASSSA